MKVAVFYYTQSGQALNVAKAVCSPLEVSIGDSSTSGAVSRVVYKQICPEQDYPFPWNSDEFFDTFPETRLGLPPSGIMPIDFSDVENADLVIIVGQSLYLSPSLPLQSFFADERVGHYMKGRKVVFINACRNMWLMTARQVKTCVRRIHADLVGHIVMQDDAPNLVSVLTIVRWLMYRKQEATCILPRAGISEEKLSAASRFGTIIGRWEHEGRLWNLQEELLAAGAIRYKPSILFLEKAGHRMFGIWAKFIRRKGGFRDIRRRCRVRLFCLYLLTVLFLLSPFAQLFFFLTYPLQHVSQHRQIDCSIE